MKGHVVFFGMGAGESVGQIVEVIPWRTSPFNRMVGEDMTERGSSLNWRILDVADQNGAQSSARAANNSMGISKLAILQTDGRVPANAVTLTTCRL